MTETFEQQLARGRLFSSACPTATGTALKAVLDRYGKLEENLSISALEARNELLQKALENEIAGCGQCEGTGFFDIDPQGKAQCVKCYNARKALAATEGE